MTDGKPNAALGIEGNDIDAEAIRQELWARIRAPAEARARGMDWETYAEGLYPLPSEAILSRDLHEAVRHLTAGYGRVSVEMALTESRLPLVGPLVAWARRNLTSHLLEPYLGPTLERSFLEERRRSRTIPRFFSEGSCLKLVFATLSRASQRCQGVRMSEIERQQLKLLDANSDCSRWHTRCCWTQGAAVRRLTHAALFSGSSGLDLGEVRNTGLALFTIMYTTLRWAS